MERNSELIYHVKFKYPTHQMSFHTIKVLDCINFIESYEVKEKHPTVDGHLLHQLLNFVN